jgi:uncharacterized protein
MHLSRYVKIYPCKDDPSWLLLYSTKKGGAILVPESLLAAFEEGSSHSSNQEALARLGFLVPDTVEERNEFRDVLAEANRRRKLFRAMVLLNMDCNLACIYCYERGMKGNLYMSDETAGLLVEFVERDYLSHGKRVSLTFHGGEPLMSTDLIIILSKRLKAAASCHGVEYSFNLVTNGTLLTRQMVDKLIPLGLNGAKVTLDGPVDNHNKNRPFVSGKGSFDVIVGNMKEVCDKIKVQVGGNYTPENYRQFPRLLDFLLDKGLTPERISLIKFDPVTKSGGKYPLPEFNEGCASTDEPWLMEASIYLREEILKRGFHTPRLAPSICMVEGPDELVVNFDGTLFKCPAFLGWPEMSVGDLRTGISDYAVSHNLDVWKNDECLDCAYLPLCFGGCRFLKLLREGRIGDVDCWKRYLDATLEAFVGQDLKYRPKRPGNGDKGWGRGG